MKENKYNKDNNIGKFRNKIAIQDEQNSTNENGFPVRTWVTKKQVWANIKTPRGSEFVSASSEYDVETYRFIIRYTTGISAKDRILFKGREYDIQAILQDDEMRDTLTLIANTRNRVIST